MTLRTNKTNTYLNNEISKRPTIALWKKENDQTNRSNSPRITSDHTAKLATDKSTDETTNLQINCQHKLSDQQHKITKQTTKQRK
jgi:hypothetical protein